MSERPQSVLSSLLSDDRGNATIEWTMASALMVFLGIAILFAIYGTVPQIYESLIPGAFADLGL